MAKLKTEERIQETETQTVQKAPPKKTKTKTKSSEKIHQCVVCQKTLLEKDMKKLDGSKWYCPSCAEVRSKEIETNKAMNDFLYKLSGEDADAMPNLVRQVKKLRDDNGWKLEAILATLEYVYDGGPNLTYNPQYGIISVVERYYPIVRDFYIDRRELRWKFPEEEVLEILGQPPRIITMKRSQILKKEQEYTEKQKNILYGPPLDLDDIPDVDDYDDEDY